MKYERIAEWELKPELDNQITALRNKCFPDHAVNRSYYKQRPHLRELIWDADTLVGHLGLDYRMIAVAGQSITILGIIDLCVDPKWRKRGLASKLLESAIKLGQEGSIDFLLLAADDHRLYIEHGFVSISVKCTWLRIDEFKSYGVATERLDNVLMVLKVGQRDWPEGPLDMLGYLF